MKLLNAKTLGNECPKIISVKVRMGGAEETFNVTSHHQKEGMHRLNTCSSKGVHSGVTLYETGDSVNAMFDCHFWYSVNAKEQSHLTLGKKSEQDECFYVDLSGKGVDGEIAVICS